MAQSMSSSASPSPRTTTPPEPDVPATLSEIIAILGAVVANVPSLHHVVARMEKLAHDFHNPGAGTTPPENVDVPAITGTGEVGSILQCTMGNWSGEPTGYVYVWKADGMAIPGATGVAYTVLSGDAGKSITCVVTASNAAGDTEAPPSNAIAVPAAAAASAGAQSSRDTDHSRSSDKK